MPALLPRSMVKCAIAFLFVTGSITLGSPFSKAEDKFDLVDGDRIVLIGNTLIEREQRYGYWETALTSQYPDKTITFRNLGWSGDTVCGEARAGFDTPQEGYRRLIERTLSVKPTVIVLGYGTNESFADRFQVRLEVART